MRQGKGNTRLDARVQEMQEASNCLIREMGDVGEEGASWSGELGTLRVGRVSGERRADREEGLEGKCACFKAGMGFMPGKCVRPEGRKLPLGHKQGGGDDESAWPGLTSACDARGWGMVCMAILDVISLVGFPSWRTVRGWPVSKLADLQVGHGILAGRG
jgi:hypothetical protein